MKTDLLDLRNTGYMEMMQDFPDGHFDIAIVDPPLVKFYQVSGSLYAALTVYTLALLVVTDIKENSSMIIAAGKSAVIDELPFERKDDTLFYGKGVCSRKKQIFPAAAEALSKLALA